MTPNPNPVPPTGKLLKLYQDIVRAVIKLNGKRIWLHDIFLYNKRLDYFHEHLIEMERDGYIQGYKNHFEDKDGNPERPANIPPMSIQIAVIEDNIKKLGF